MFLSPLHSLARPLRPVLAACCVAVVAVAFAAAVPARGQPVLPAEMQDLSRLYRTRLAEMGARYQEAVSGLPRQYETDLATLLDRYQKSGNLDGVLATAQEQKRYAEARQKERDPFELTPEMPPSAIVAAPPELKALQEQYVQRHKDAASQRQREISDLTAKYLARLEGLKSDLTRAGRIAEAIAVKTEYDRLSKGTADETLVQLAETLVAEQQAVQSGSATNRDAEIPVYGSVPNWAKWTHESTASFSREHLLFGHRDLPDELDIDFAPRTGRGRIFGRSTVDRQQVGPYLCSWFGKAISWRVKDPSTLTANFELESRELSAGQDFGPHAQLVLMADKTPLKYVNAPIMARVTTLRVVKDSASNRVALMWLQGKVTETIELPPNAEIRILLAVTVRNPGEMCDTSITLQ